MKLNKTISFMNLVYSSTATAHQLIPSQQLSAVLKVGTVTRNIMDKAGVSLAQDSLKEQVKEYSRCTEWTVCIEQLFVCGSNSDHLNMNSDYRVSNL